MAYRIAFQLNIALPCFAHVLRIAKWQSLISDEYFTVDGTMIEVWVSVKSFTKKDGSGPPPSEEGRNATTGYVELPRRRVHA